jgi:hypothetical protein
MYTARPDIGQLIVFGFTKEIVLRLINSTLHWMHVAQISDKYGQKLLLTEGRKEAV